MRDQIITEASLTPEEVMSMKTAQAKFALLVEILWRPERIRLLVD